MGDVSPLLHHPLPKHPWGIWGWWSLWSSEQLVPSNLNFLFSFFRRMERRIVLFFNNKSWEEIKEYSNLLHVSLGVVLVLQQEASKRKPQAGGRCNLFISRCISTILNPNPSTTFYSAEQVALWLLLSCIRQATGLKKKKTLRFALICCSEFIFPCSGALVMGE